MSSNKRSLSSDFADLAKRIERVKARSEVDEIIGNEPKPVIFNGGKALPIELIRASGVPTKYLEAKLDSEGLPEDAKGRHALVLQTLLSVTSKPSVSCLIGLRGSGKTHMACALVMEFCRRGKSAGYCDATDYLLKLKASYGKDSKDDQTKIEGRYIRLDLLVLDEMQERGETEWEDRMLTRIINKRYNEQKTTILISNQTEEQFVNRIGLSIADRINENGGFMLCDWDSLRGRI